MVNYHGPLHGFQKVAVKSVLNGNRALFLEMGLGKTMSTLEIIHQLGYKKTLIIAPKIICENVWGQEIEKWEYQFPVHRLSGSPRRRLKIAADDKDGVYLMTPGLVVWAVDNGILNMFDYIVIDELTTFKNTKSKRWRALASFVRKNASLPRLGLTGTPSPKGLHELWAQLFVLDNGVTLGKKKGPYIDIFFKDHSPEPFKYNQYRPRPGAEKRILDRLRERGVISMKASDVLKQQEIVDLDNIIITLPPGARKIYTELERDMIATMPDGTVVLPDHDSTVSIKMRQVSSGFMLDDAGEAHILHWEKAKALKEYLELCEDQSQLVVFTYKIEAEMIAKMLGPTPKLAGGVGSSTRQKHIRNWNLGSLPVMLVQPQAAGHGVNLQDGGHNILFYSSDWNLETYQQVRARLNRQGQKSPVFCKHMVAGHVENRIIKSLQAKAKNQDRLMTKLHA